MNGFMTRNPETDLPMEFRQYLSKIGKKGGSKGGKKAAANMTPGARKERAKKAAAASAKVRSEKARLRREAEKEGK